MDKKKAIELKKYLEKKQKQKTRDEIMQQIAGLTKTSEGKTSKSIKNKIKRKNAKKERFEDKFVDSEEQEVKEIDNSMNLAVSLHEDAQLNAPIAVLPDIKNEIFNEDMQLKTEESKLKEEIMAINEVFTVFRCPNRLDSIQQQRMKLDIFYEESEIVSIIKYNLITFIQGNTGCGKTTQIPQFLFENGFAAAGLIGVTQPRRFSAVSISSRINSEMNEQYCGYKIKYENNISKHTKIKILTEGVLFKEIQSDFLLKNYSVIILDEVHERSTNSDILVGLLSKIVQIRMKMKIPLRLVLMSATLDPTCYNKVLGEYALVTLKSKQFEISVFFEDQTPENYVDGAFNKISAILQSEKCIKTNKKLVGGLSKMPSTISNDSSSSILVFLASKEDIYGLKDKLEAFNQDIVVLPLHSGLNKSEQSKVYEKYPTRKIILATNIAETSITIDDIVFVIDCGRVKRKLTDQSSVLYKVDFISKSSACQRAGRCGRTAPGVCYRIYNGDLFEKLTDHNIPQILAEPFDSSMLQLKGMGIPNIFGFPFVDQPLKESIKDSLESLQSIGALDSKGNITNMGKSMCHYPVNPRFARLLITTANENVSIFSKIAIIVSILSCNFEFKRNEDTEAYYNSSKSDLIVGMKIFIDYLKSKNKKRFAFNVGISVESFEEILKMATYLMTISGKGTVNDLTIEMTSVEEETICKFLFYAFADQLAVNCGTYYLYKNGDISVSSDSVKADGCNFVFNHIICGTKRSWAVGITLVSPSWFK